MTDLVEKMTRHKRPEKETVYGKCFGFFCFIWVFVEKKKTKSLFTCRATSSGGIWRTTTSDIFFDVLLLLCRRSRIKLHWRRLCHLCLKSHLVVTGSSLTSSLWAQIETRATNFLAHLVLQLLYNFVLALTFCFPETFYWFRL